MEIQDLTYENYRQQPIFLPDRPFTHAPQETDTFRTTEGLIELNISAEQSANSNSQSSKSLEKFDRLGDFLKSRDDFGIEELRTDFEAKSAELSGRLRQFFSSHGIQAPVAADLSVDSQGRVVVTGNAELGKTLEAEYAHNPELNKEFKELSASASLLRAADAASDFAQAYERNPEAAIDDFAHLFSDRFKFSYHFEDSKLSAGFKSESGSPIAWWQET